MTVNKEYVRFLPEVIEKAKARSTLDVITHYSGFRFQKQGGEWRGVEHDSLVVYSDGRGWCWYSRNVKGASAIDWLKLSRFFKGRGPGDTSATSRIRGRRYDYLRDCDSERFQEICYTLLQADEEAKYMLYCDGGTYVPARGFSEDDVKKRYWQLQEAIFPFYIKLGSSLRFDEFTRNYGSAVAEAGKNACDYCRDRDIDIDNTPKSNFTII